MPLISQSSEFKVQNLKFHKRSLGKLSRRWEDDIKMALKELG